MNSKIALSLSFAVVLAIVLIALTPPRYDSNSGLDIESDRKSVENPRGDVTNRNIQSQDVTVTLDARALARSATTELGELTEQILGIPWTDLGLFADQQLRPLFEEDADMALAFLDKLCSEIASHNPAHALDLAENLIDLEGVTSIERKVLYSWGAEGENDIRKHLIDRGDVASDHRISILTSLIQNERNDELGTWLTWIGNLSSTPESGNPSASNRYLQGVFAEKLVTHVTPENLDAIAGMIQENSSNRAVASQATRFISKMEDSGLEWIMGLDIDRDIREGAIDNLFYHWGIENPEKAAELLSSPGIASRLYTPRSPDESPADRRENEKVFFDTLLRSYLEASLGTAPIEGHLSAELFNDPKLRVEFQARAEELAYYHVTNPETDPGEANPSPEPSQE